MTATPGIVMVVDDNAQNRMLLAANLRKHEYTVVTAEDGRQALELLRSQPFDVVLLDLLMPEMDGYQVLEQMRAHSYLRHIPVIVISALDEMESVVRCIEMGATDYLTKPINQVLLHARLNASLANKRLHDMEQAHLKAIQAERERADRLLLNILPAPIAEQLKQGREKIAEKFSDVSVLFADVVDFTRFAALRSPDEVLEVLNTIFSTFDWLVERYGLEKIKTLGDAYMVAGGLPIPKADHAEAMAELALDMRMEFNSLNVVTKWDQPLSLRIGVHCGPVIAGVIGYKKFIYDLWGDTVNTASRMQSHCVAGGIQVSSAFYEKLRGKYEFQEQGKMLVKSKGEMMTYLLVGRCFNLK
ncbi:MAG: response regulator [Chloroflexota bacterium]|nr:MAG: response regulator [Chloroflexota bacterium]